MQQSDGLDASLEGFQRFFDSPTFSDLSIRFSGREIRAHKIILCSQARWFTVACEGGFLEASMLTIVLEDDNPNAIDGMLRYLYGFDPMESCGSSLPAVTLKHVVYLYATADKYDVPHLRGEMLSSFKDRAERLWHILWLSGKLADIIESVYDYTPPNDSMRQAVVRFSVDNLSTLLQNSPERFRALLEDIPDFGTDIIMNLLQKSSTSFYLQQIPPTKFATAALEFRGPLQTAFHLASQRGDDEYCRFLIAQGQDVDVRHENGETALHLAAWFGHLEVARLLVEHGAKIDTAMMLGASPITWARIQDHQDITAYLVSRGSSEMRSRN
ncbi:hypothetical protein DL95DRAFT_468345 [Leptodontidium sp. 2 PMI_412]|nr:hypothetical protein DL95DRAFT_468345 [Leptodontidium sp. 2 PMI_412]